MIPAATVVPVRDKFDVNVLQLAVALAFTVPGEGVPLHGGTFTILTLSIPISRPLLNPEETDPLKRSTQVGELTLATTVLFVQLAIDPLMVVNVLNVVPPSVDN